MVHVRDALFQETDLNEVQGILILFVTEIRRKKLLDQFLNGSWVRTPAVSPTAVKWLWVSLDRYNMDIAVCLQSATQRQSSHGPYRYSNMQKWVFLLFPTLCHSSLYNSCNKRRVVTSVLLTWEVWGYLRHSIWHFLSKNLLFKYNGMHTLWYCAIIWRKIKVEQFISYMSIFSKETWYQAVKTRTWQCSHLQKIVQDAIS